MGRRRGKRRLTAAEKDAKRQRCKEFQMIFINGKQKWVRREPTVDGLSVDEFIRHNADPIWLLQEGMYEALSEHERNWDGLGQALPRVELDGAEGK